VLQLQGHFGKQQRIFLSLFPLSSESSPMPLFILSSAPLSCVAIFSNFI
jgi:hypothetical protein